MNEPLEELIKKIISKSRVDTLDTRVESFVDYKNKYMILKPSVKVTIELTDGKVIKADVTDYFEKALK